MQNLYLDLDDTFVDTEVYIRAILKNNLIPYKSNNSVYGMRCIPVYSDIMRDVFKNYSVIPLKEDAEECLKLLSTEYNVIFCSSYITDEEGESKKRFAELYKKDIILCGGINWDKSRVDMSGGIMVDDAPEALSKSNATTKIQVANPYKAYGLKYADYLRGDVFVENLSQVVEYLMGGEALYGSSKLRGDICKRVQECCKC